MSQLTPATDQHASQGVGLQLERNLSLTPFAGRLQQDIETAVTAALKLGRGVRVQARPRLDKSSKDIGAALAITLHLSSRQLSLEIQEPRALLCASDSAEDQVLASELSTRLARAGDAQIQAIWDAVKAQRPFRGMVDKMFRFILHSPPYRMGILRLGFRCNQDCHVCWQDREWPEPPIEMYYTWIDEIAASGIDELCLSGGEPTLRKDLTDIIRYGAKEKGMRVHLQTNAIMLRREKYTQSLLDAGLTALLVSLHATVPEVSDEITRSPGTFKRTIEGIETALQCGLKVELNCLPEMTNRDVLDQYGDFVVERFVKPFPDNPIWSVMFTHPCRYYDDADWKAKQAPYDLIADGLIASTKTLEAAGVTNATLLCCGFPPCLFKKNPEIVGFSPKQEIEFRDLNDRMFVDACAGCAVRDRCPGIRKEYVEAFGDRGIAPFEVAPENPIEYRDTHLSMFM